MRNYCIDDLPLEAQLEFSPEERQDHRTKESLAIGWSDADGQRLGLLDAGLSESDLEVVTGARGPIVGAENEPGSAAWVRLEDVRAALISRSAYCRVGDAVTWLRGESRLALLREGNFDLVRAQAERDRHVTEFIDPNTGLSRK